jgi:3-oxoacyl-[acyl-carrier protein] reductase
VSPARGRPSRRRNGVVIDLDGRVAIVTGGSRGIGRACVESLAAAGAAVVFSYHRHEAAARATAAAARRRGGRVVAVRADVARPAGCRRLVAAALRRFGRLDILVNNAGIWEPPEGIPVESISDDQWARTLRVNLDGSFHCVRAAVPAMKAQHFGRIINLSSTAGQRGEARHADYAASKGALISFTKALATELGPDGILVNAVAPWWVLTDMSREALAGSAGAEAAPREASPLGRVATPEEIAGPVLFLCSPLADFITGEILNVNGGTVLCG